MNYAGPIPSDTEQIALAMPFNEAEEKRVALRFMGASIYDRKQIPLAVALSCEAWLATNPPPGVQPRDFAGRIEVALLAAASMGDEFSKVVSIPVTRDDQNRMVPTGETKDSDYKSVRLDILHHFFRGFFMAHVKATAPSQ